MANSYWPVEPHENKKVIPMITMSFLICFVYTVLRDMKDVLVLDSMPATAISGLKLYCTLPMSIVVMLVYTKMSLKLDKHQVFYYCMSAFLVFFIVFTCILLPFQDKIEMGKEWGIETSNALSVKFFSTFVSIFANWTTSLLYVFSELWGTVVLSLLFWGFANDICRTSEAKRFYTLFNLGANLSLLFVGGFLIVSAEASENKHGNEMLYPLMAVCIVFTMIIMGLYRYMQVKVLSDPRLCPPKEEGPKKNKVKLGFFESFKVLFTNPYILLIAVMVLMYGVSVNLIETYFKYTWGAYFKTKPQKTRFQGIFSLGTGSLSLFLLTFVGGKSIRLMGWTKTALITPVVLICSGLPFMILFAVKKHFAELVSYPVLVAFGYIAVVGSKACKYSFFDPTKEMAYIPLGEDRGRAKAAVDVVGARGGKSLGSISIQAFQGLFNTEDAGTYVETISSILITGVLTWATGTITLGKQYNRKIKEQSTAAELGATSKA